MGARTESGKETRKKKGGKAHAGFDWVVVKKKKKQ